MLFLQRAKERGAKIVKEIWEETDEGGTVRFARVQTVSSMIDNIKYFNNVTAMMVNYFLYLNCSKEASLILQKKNFNLNWEFNPGPLMYYLYKIHQ